VWSPAAASSRMATMAKASAPIRSPRGRPASAPRSAKGIRIPAESHVLVGMPTARRGKMVAATWCERVLRLLRHEARHQYLEQQGEGRGRSSD
jgi:hypothetical protein